MQTKDFIRNVQLKSYIHMLAVEDIQLLMLVLKKNKFLVTLKSVN